MLSWDSFFIKAAVRAPVVVVVVVVVVPWLSPIDTSDHLILYIVGYNGTVDQQ